MLTLIFVLSACIAADPAPTSTTDSGGPAPLWFEENSGLQATFELLDGPNAGERYSLECSLEETQQSDQGPAGLWSECSNNDVLMRIMHHPEEGSAWVQAWIINTEFDASSPTYNAKPAELGHRSFNKTYFYMDGKVIANSGSLSGSLDWNIE